MASLKFLVLFSIHHESSHNKSAQRSGCSSSHTAGIEKKHRAQSQWLLGDSNWECESSLSIQCTPILPSMLTGTANAHFGFCLLAFLQHWPRKRWANPHRVKVEVIQHIPRLPVALTGSCSGCSSIASAVCAVCAVRWISVMLWRRKCDVGVSVLSYDGRWTSDTSDTSMIMLSDAYSLFAKKQSKETNALSSAPYHRPSCSSRRLCYD